MEAANLSLLVYNFTTYPCLLFGVQTCNLDAAAAADFLSKFKWIVNSFRIIQTNYNNHVQNRIVCALQCAIMLANFRHQMSESPLFATRKRRFATRVNKPRPFFLSWVELEKWLQCNYTELSAHLIWKRSVMIQKRHYYQISPWGSKKVSLFPAIYLFCLLLPIKNNHILNQQEGRALLAHLVLEKWTLIIT